MSKSTASAQFDRNDVEVLAVRACHEGFLRVEQLRLRHRLYAGGWSEPIQRELLLKDEAVGVLLYDPTCEQVVLIRQFRVGALERAAGPWLLELVAGMVESGENAEQVAIRETLEESNCIPADLIKICSYYNSPGTSSEKLTLYCGRVDARAAGGIHGLDAEHEDIEVVVLSLDEVNQAIASGTIDNAMTLIAVQWLQLHKSAVLQAWNIPSRS